MIKKACNFIVFQTFSRAFPKKWHDLFFFFINLFLNFCVKHGNNFLQESHYWLLQSPESRHNSPFLFIINNNRSIFYTKTSPGGLLQKEQQILYIGITLNISIQPDIFQRIVLEKDVHIIPPLNLLHN